MLTFEEFLSIPPCTTAKHSTVDDTPAPAPAPPSDDTTSQPDPPVAAPVPERPVKPIHSPAIAPPSNPPSPAPAQDETEFSDDESLEIPANASCRRRGCNAVYEGGSDASRDAETCVHHPGQPVFHEGSKGWSCCKKRVLEFDEFLKIQGCKERRRHLFVGKGKPPGEEKVDSVR